MSGAVRSTRAALAACGLVLACREPAAPAAVTWDDWPWMATSIASPSVAVTGSSVVPASPPNVLRVSARFINPGADSVLVQHGACAFGIRLREVNGRALMPVAWDNRPAGSGCYLPLYGFYVPAKGSRDVMVADVRPLELRGVVPAGEYHVNVVWRSAKTGNVMEASAGIMVVAPVSPAVNNSRRTDLAVSR